jgi:hypothetical protein
MEVLAAAALMSVLTMLALLMTRSSAEFYSRASINGATELAIESTLNEISNELLESRPSTITQPAGLLTPPSSSSTLTFRRVAHYEPATGIYEFGPLTRIAVENNAIYISTDVESSSPQQRMIMEHVATLAKDEIANGLDDNGNGLVDEAGLAFVLETPFTVRVHLSLERRNAEGSMEVVSGSTLVQLRNR